MNNSEDLFEQDIERAIKARGLSESMAQWDREMHRQHTLRLRRLIAYPLAAAAMLAALFFVPLPTASTAEWRQLAQTTGQEMHALYLTAGAGSADLIYEATEKMTEGHYAAAYRQLCAAEKALDEEFTDPTDAQYRETKQDIRRLKALCDLSRGQLYYTLRGRRALS